MDYCRALLPESGFLSAKHRWPKFDTRIKIGEIKFHRQSCPLEVVSRRSYPVQVGFVAHRSRSVAHPPPFHLTNTKKWSEEIFNGKRLLSIFQIGRSFETLEKNERSH